MLPHGSSTSLVPFYPERRVTELRGDRRAPTSAGRPSVRCSEEASRAATCSPPGCLTVRWVRGLLAPGVLTRPQAGGSAPHSLTSNIFDQGSKASMGQLTGNSGGGRWMNRVVVIKLM